MILFICAAFAACSVRSKVVNERDEQAKPIPVLVTVVGSSTTTPAPNGAATTVFHPVEVKPAPSPLPSPEGFDLLTPLLVLIPGVGGLLTVLVQKYLAARTAVKELIAGAQDWKSDMTDDEKKEFNATMSATQSPKTRGLIAKYKGKK